jgi:hypothetical protein
MRIERSIPRGVITRLLGRCRRPIPLHVPLRLRVSVAAATKNRCENARTAKPKEPLCEPFDSVRRCLPSCRQSLQSRRAHKRTDRQFRRQRRDNRGGAGASVQLQLPQQLMIRSAIRARPLRARRVLQGSLYQLLDLSPLSRLTTGGNGKRLSDITETIHPISITSMTLFYAVYHSERCEGIGLLDIGFLGCTDCALSCW